MFEDQERTEIEISAEGLRFTNEIKNLGADGIFQCNQCAKCAAACPLVLAGFPFFNKRVIQAILLGTKEKLLSDVSIWACQACNRCTQLCPRDVDPFEIILAVRRAAVQEYALPAMALEGIKSLYDFGHAVYLSEAGNPRKNLGLPEKPPSTLTNPESLQEVRAIMRKTVLINLGIIPMGDTV
ncbi:MAG: 4Fe-4S dicluster domain-containing protein [Bacillota bacterium]